MSKTGTEKLTGESRPTKYNDLKMRGTQMPHTRYSDKRPIIFCIIFLCLIGSAVTALPLACYMKSRVYFVKVH